MRPSLGRGDVDSHLWPCPQCGSANGLNAHACWNCEAELRTPSADELPPPIAASLEKRGILERVAQWEESRQPEMAYATEGAETDALHEQRGAERAGGPNSGLASLPEGRSSPPWEPEGWSAPPSEPDSWPTPQLESESGSTAPSEPDSGSTAPLELESLSGSSAPSELESRSSGRSEPEQESTAPSEPERESTAPSEPEGESIASAQGGMSTAPPHVDSSSEAEIDGAAERPRERSMSAHDRSVEAFLALWNQSGSEPTSDDADQPAATPPIESTAEPLAGEGAFADPGAAIGHPPFEHSRRDAPAEPESVLRRPADEPDVDRGAEHPPIETFEGSAVSAGEHPPIRIGDDEPAVGAHGIGFGPAEPPTRRDADVDAFGPLPSARQESDPFHDVALGERFAELAQASARNARRRRRVTLAAGGVLVAVMIAVAYPTFRSGVRIDLSSQELQSAAAPARPDAPRTPSAVDQTPAPATASTQTATAPAAEPAATPRAAPPVPPAARTADRADQPPVVAAPAPPATNRASRTPPREVLERFERRQPPTAGPARDTVGGPNEPARAEAAAPPPTGAAAAGATDETRTDNSSITCTERILALGLCGPEPSSRKE